MGKCAQAGDRERRTFGDCWGLVTDRRAQALLLLMRYTS